MDPKLFDFTELETGCRLQLFEPEPNFLFQGMRSEKNCDDIGVIQSEDSYSRMDDIDRSKSWCSELSQHKRNGKEEEPTEPTYENSPASSPRTLDSGKRESSNTFYKARKDVVVKTLLRSIRRFFCFLLSKTNDSDRIDESSPNLNNCLLLPDNVKNNLKQRTETLARSLLESLENVIVPEEMTERL